MDGLPVRRLSEWLGIIELPPAAARPAAGVTGESLAIRLLELTGERGPELRLQYAWEVVNGTGGAVVLRGRAACRSRAGQISEAPFAFRLPPRWEGHLLALVPVPAAVAESGVAELALVPGP